VKLRVTWWTKSPRQHEMVASHDRVLTAIRETLQRRKLDQSKKSRPRCLNRRSLSGVFPDEAYKCICRYRQA
jgi:hypothetical protein